MSRRTRRYGSYRDRAPMSGRQATRPASDRETGGWSRWGETPARDSWPAPPARRRLPPAHGASGRGSDRLDLDRVQPAHHAMHARDLHLALDEGLELRVLRIAGL